MYHGLKQKHGKIQGVSMLPFGLVAGFAGEKEIRIIELAENGFTFRTAEKIADPELFRVCFYHYPKLEYEQVELHSYTLECSGKYEFYYEYTLYLDNIGDMPDDIGYMDADETENGKSREYEGCKENKEYREYRKQVQALLLWYDRYIRLKLTGDENELASAMTAYPENGDAVTAESFEEQKKQWFDSRDQGNCRKETGRERATEEKSQNRSEVMPETGSALEQFEWAVELDTTWLYEEYLEKEYGIARFEWESCGYDMAFPVGKNSLHLPFYQTNTSQYCALYAKCTTGERGKQKLVKQCPGFCKDYAFLYPDHLKMVGRYNSLFAMDGRIFEDDPGSGSGIENEVGMKTGIKEMFQKWKIAGADRLVVNLL